MNKYFRGYIPNYHYYPYSFNNYNAYSYNKKRFTRLNEKEYNEKYFRPSKFPSINTLNLNDAIYEYYDNQQPDKLSYSHLMDSPKNTIINFFSILREANQIKDNDVGCGTVGMLDLPYPIAYKFLSSKLQNKISYEQFLKKYENIYHINLIKILKLPNRGSSVNQDIFFIEFETFDGSGFSYYEAYYDIEKENNQYKINNFDYYIEDFLCAPYHGWQHNAEMKVEYMYGNWCNLIKKQYPTKKEGFLKRILIDGTDENKYLFTFVELTNGTDVEVFQHKKEDGDWVLIEINPYECLK